ncbi:DNA polymerase I [Cryptosporangium aurantiacum]|uniref:DNA polymerase I n=1 Tax=Cryptosporangium aurantiacum TaxID=134849 RepID=A0A1M7IDG8_9ACTN|nr:DNA polymerase I [Cryptosporangium aurantiacum]SHM38812.1 DNA polymerase I [Cryptosporangium aurantiacum]
MSQTASRLLLLDGHSLAYRAFFALPVENFSTTTGQPTNAVYGFTSMLINVLRDEKPTHLAVAFDVSRTSFRTEAYAEYKAGRSETPSDFKGQVSLIQEILDALQIPFLSLEGYEADDILATLATEANAAGAEVLICSGDRDAFQLVNDKTTVLYPRKGVSDLARVDPAEVVARYGVPPTLYRHLAALVGESSDNLPGVPKVGPKTAAKWLTQYGSLEGLVEHVDEVKGMAGENLRAHLADVLRNYQINALMTDLELPLHLSDLERRSWDREKVHQVFDTLQFRVLRDRLYATLEAAEPEADSTIEVAGELLGPDAVAPWLAAHAPSGVRTGVAFDGSWGRGTGELRAIGVAGADGAAAWFEPAQLTAADDAAVAAWLADEARTKAVHDVKGPLLAVTARGWTLAGVTADTALIAYLVRPDQRTYDLADLTLRNLRRELRAEGPSDGQLSLDGLDEDSAKKHLMEKAQATRELADALEAELGQRGGTALLTGVELPLVKVLADMERVGIAADTTHLADLEAHFAAEVKASAQAAYGVVGREFNLGSPKQLQVILFDELGLPKTKRIKTGYTTDADSLQWLYAQTEHPLLEHLLRHRDVAKLKTTVDGLLKTVADDGRIHTTYNQTIAATGRLSSTDPNLQNIPVRTEEGRRIRRAFVVGEGYETLLTADYSQIEMRIMSHLSADPTLIEAFTSGHDFHAATAAGVFGVEPTAVSGEQRSKIKAMNYGLAYGLSAYGLSQQLGITTEEAKALMTDYFEQFGGVRDYLTAVVARARGEGYTETILGRRRYLPDLNSDNRQRREMAERMALNAPIQGSAADIIKVAMLAVDKRIREEGLRSRLLLQVHDELVFETAPGEREALEALVRDAMGAAYPLDLPLDVSVGVGRTWDDAAH